MTYGPRFVQVVVYGWWCTRGVVQKAAYRRFGVVQVALASRGRRPGGARN